MSKFFNKFFLRNNTIIFEYTISNSKVKFIPINIWYKFCLVASGIGILKENKSIQNSNNIIFNYIKTGLVYGLVFNFYPLLYVTNYIVNDKNFSYKRVIESFRENTNFLVK